MTDKPQKYQKKSDQPRPATAQVEETKGGERSFRGGARGGRGGRGGDNHRGGENFRGRDGLRPTTSGGDGVRPTTSGGERKYHKRREGEEEGNEKP